MECENLALGDLVGVLEEDFTVDTAGSDERWVKGINLIGGHDDFYVSAVVETVELV